MLVVDDVVALALPPENFSSGGGGGGGDSGIGGSSATGIGGRCFFWPPKDHDRPADFKNPELDFGIGGMGTSAIALLFAALQSSWPPRSADEGAVDALLWRDELSVEAVLIVLDEPLPLPLPACQLVPLK